MSRDQSELVKLLAQRLFREKGTALKMDSRKISRGDVFLALPGSRQHGNHFIQGTLEQGASLAIADRSIPYPESDKVWGVDDPEKFLGDVAREMREMSRATFIAITGSNGKTTTKDMVAEVVGTGKSVHKTDGNFNNQLGVPLTLCQLKEWHTRSVIEMGTNGPGEIDALGSLVRPGISVLTTVAPAHLEGLGSRSRIAAEKACIFRHMSQPGQCLIPQELMKHSSIRKELKGKKVVHFGAGNEELDKARIYRGDLVWESRGMPYRIKTPALHNIHNAQAALEVGRVLGIEDKVMSKRLKRWKPSNHRMCVLNWRKRKILDDSYNANPVSVLSAVTTAVMLKNRTGQKIFAAFGDMKELGKNAKSFHQRLGLQMIQAGVDVLVTVGDLARSFHVPFEKEGGRMGKHCSDVREMAGFLQEFSKPHDIILIKGSRSMRMERVIDFLKVST